MPKLSSLVSRALQWCCGVTPDGKYWQFLVKTEQCLERDPGTGGFGMDVSTKSHSLCSADRGLVIAGLAKANAVSLFGKI